MNIKTSANVISSLHGAAFRRGTWDGRTRVLRAIRTLGDLQRQGHRPTAAGKLPQPLPGRNGRADRSAWLAVRCRGGNRS